MGGDTIMNDDSVMSPKKVEPKKAPVKKPEMKQSTTAAKVTTSSKGPTGPQI